MTDIDFRWFWWVSEFWNMIILAREGISTTALSICKMSVHYCDHRMVLYPAFLFLRIHCKEAYFSIFFEIWSLRMQEIYCNQRDENRATVAKSVSSSCFLQKHRGLSVALCSAETSHSASSCAKKIHCICSNNKTLSLVLPTNTLSLLFWWLMPFCKAFPTLIK